MWGGLRPIPSRLCLDILTLASLAYCTLSSPDSPNTPAILLLTCLVTYATAGLTHRWTLTFPMVPFVLLQGIRRLDFITGTTTTDGHWMASLAISVVCGALVLLAAALTILFPAVELNPVDGRYRVGVVDLHLPVDFTDGVRRRSLLGTQQQSDEDEPSDAYVTARLLYPTNDEDETYVPYLDPDEAPDLCSELMKAGAPGPLKGLGWMLHTWRLTRIRAKRNAKPATATTGGGGGGDDAGDDGRKKLPLAVYSHGLTGLSAIYSYQALSLAADGTVVLMIDHTDASAPAVRRRDGSVLFHDSSHVRDLYLTGKEVDYVRKRRAQTEHRTEECLSSLIALRNLDRRNIPDLERVGVTFVDRLDTTDVTLMGHSFGGSTVLTAAARCGGAADLVSRVVAHEPAVDWMPDHARRALFPDDRLDDGGRSPSCRYDGGTGGYEDGGGSGNDTTDGEEKKETPTVDRGQSSLHDVDMFFLYSNQWVTTGWGSYPLVKSMHERGVLGRGGGASDVGFVEGAKHQEFSDTCMMTPIWLARATGLTGDRNPHHTAAEIAARTIAFIEASRQTKKANDRIKVDR